MDRAAELQSLLDRYYVAHGKEVLRADALERALRELFGLVESGALVRNTLHDAEGGYAVKAMNVVMVLKRAQEALAAPLPEKQSEARAASAGLCEICRRRVWTAIIALAGDISPHNCCHARHDGTDSYNNAECYRLGYERLRAASAGEGALRARLLEQVESWERNVIAWRGKIGYPSWIYETCASVIRYVLTHEAASNASAPEGPSKAVESGAALAPAQRETEKEQK